MVKAVLDAFPGATIDAVRDLKTTASQDESAESGDEAAAEPITPEDEA